MNTNHNRIKVADLEQNEPDKILKTNDKGELEFIDSKQIQYENYNALDCTIEGKALDARQGKVLKDMIDNKDSASLINDLTTGGTTKALTAEMGKNLNQIKADLANPAFSGVPTAPTAATGTSTSQIATTEFVNKAVLSTANDSEVLHKTGNEIKTGGLILLPGAGANALVASTTNMTTIQADSGSGIGILGLSGSGIAVMASSVTGVGFVVDNYTGNVADLASFRINGSIKAKISNQGDITGNSFIKTGGLNSQFLKADGSVDSNSYALNSNIVHKIGDETIRGRKSFERTDATDSSIEVTNSFSTGDGLHVENTANGNGISLHNRGNGGVGFNLGNHAGGTGFNLENWSLGTGFNIGNNNDNGIGLFITNRVGGIGSNFVNLGTGRGVNIYNEVSGRGISILNKEDGIGAYFENEGTGNCIVTNCTTGIGFNYVGQNAGVNTYTVDKFGNITSNSFVKTGGTGTQSLLANGKVLNNPISGIGTPGILPRFSSSSLLEDSIISASNQSATIKGRLYLNPTEGGALTFQSGVTPFGSIASSQNTQASGSSVATDLNVYVYGNDPFNIWTNRVKRITVLGDGNVGIGNANPTEKLEVNGNISAKGGIYSEFIGASYNGTNNVRISTATRGTASLVFETALTERARISASGKFLINTITDNTVDALQVNGTISTSGISTQALSADADATFNAMPDYSMKTTTSNAIIAAAPDGFYYLESFRYVDINYGMQRATYFTGPNKGKVYVRVKDAGTWTSWIEK